MAQRPIAVDLFSGAGGMSLGFEAAGFDIAVAVDSDAHHVTTHHRNFPYGKAVRASVADLTGAAVRDWLEGRPVDLVFGGPPCQGFSTMGGRDTGDPRNSLVHHFVRMVGELRPRAAVMENVPGMASGGTAPLFEHAVQTLRSHGYRITTPVRALDAADFGVPQHRARLFLLAVRRDVAEAPIPYPSGPAAGQAPRPSVEEALSDLPDVDSDPALFRSDLAAYDRTPGPDDRYALLARGEVGDPHDRSWRRTWDRSTVSGCMRTRHTEKTAALYAACAPGTTVPGHKLPKLDPAGLAPTLRAGTTSEHGSFTAPRPVHPHRPRVITAREAARLHGYPDWFAFFPAKWHAYRQIGNSVCPPVARAVGDAVIGALGVCKADLPRPEVALHMEFPLADDRPRNHRRLTHKQEITKVIDALWAAAWDPGSGGIASPEITPADIARAVSATGADLPRIRSERLLIEAKRFRGVRRLVATPLAHGYTIMLDDARPGHGRWVRAGTLGALGESDTVKVKSAELNGAAVLSGVAAPLDEGAILGALEEPGVAERISGGAWQGIALPRDLLGGVATEAERAWVRLPGGAEVEALVVMAGSGRLPRRSRLGKALGGAGTRYALLAAPLTERHLLLAAFELEEGVARELGRAVYRAEVHQGEG